MAWGGLKAAFGDGGQREEVWESLFSAPTGRLGSSRCSTLKAVPRALIRRGRLDARSDDPEPGCPMAARKEECEGDAMNSAGTSREGHSGPMGLETLHRNRCSHKPSFLRDGRRDLCVGRRPVRNAQGFRAPNTWAPRGPLGGERLRASRALVRGSHRCSEARVSNPPAAAVHAVARCRRLAGILPPCVFVLSPFEARLSWHRGRAIPDDRYALLRVCDKCAIDRRSE